LSARVPLVRFSLIRNIETEFNAMAERISTLVEDNRLLSSAVSHDLRTPIARLRFGLDALSEEDNPEVQDRYMVRISNDLAEMEHLVEVLLDYARLEKQQHELPLQPMSLAPRVTDRINAMFNDATHKIEWDIPDEDVFVMANERYIDMVLNNVLQNAQRYGETRIRVSIESAPVKETGNRVTQRVTPWKNRYVWLVVEDDGPGIPDDERERVLKPFERGRANTERVRVTPNKSASAKNALSSGFGMGLAIVQRILDWHGAKLEFASSESLGGAEVRMGFRPATADSESDQLLTSEAPNV